MRRAQMKIGESIIILVIFFFLLMFGLIYYVKFTFDGLDKKRQERAQLIAIQSSQKVQFLAEMLCTIEGNTIRSCMDTLKLATFSKLPDDKKQIYSTMFPRTKITVRQIYPHQYTWEIYGEEATDTVHFFPVPVTLYNATAKKNNFGIVEIRVYT